MSSGDGNQVNEDNLRQPRPPRNLQDLVRYSIEAGPTPHESTDGVNKNLTNDERRFLEEALRSLTEDVSREIAKAIATLKKYRNSDDDNSTYVSALKILADRVDNIDNANDFCKLDGFDVVPICLSSHSHEIRWRMCDIIAQCAQNNPFCQEHAVKFLQPLLPMVDEDTNNQCRIKAFFAVSNIVRDCPLGLEEFLKLNGFSTVLRAMQSDIERLRNKSTFFLSSILTHQPQIIKDIFNMGFVEQLAALLQKEHSTNHEHIISSLLTIAKNHKPAKIKCRRPELFLRVILMTLLYGYENDDAFREEMDYVKQLLKLVFSDDLEEGN